MFFVYLDETDHSNKDFKDNNYSAFTAVIFETSHIEPYRSLIVQRLRKVFDRKPNEAMPFDHLHACELPRDLNDEQKLAIFEAFAEGVARHASGVYRVGYGWKTSIVNSWSKAHGMSPATASRVLSLNTITFSLMQDIPGQMCFVCELDRNNLDKIELLYNYTSLHHQELQLRMLDAFYAQQSPLLGKVVGNLYAPKRDMPMQSADFVSYQLKAAQSDAQTDFKQRLAASGALYSRLILRNEVILAG